MPRYYFQIENGHGVRDETGEELADDNAARETARLAFDELILLRRDLWTDGTVAVQIEDACRTPIGRLTATVDF